MQAEGGFGFRLLRLRLAKQKTKASLACLPCIYRHAFIAFGVLLRSLAFVLLLRKGYALCFCLLRALRSNSAINAIRR
jgi:hypothetical protein